MALAAFQPDYVTRYFGDMVTAGPINCLGGGQAAARTEVLLVWCPKMAMSARTGEVVATETGS